MGGATGGMDSTPSIPGSAIGQTDYEALLACITGAPATAAVAATEGDRKVYSRETFQMQWNMQRPARHFGDLRRQHGD
jgi:hypothetical protein